MRINKKRWQKVVELIFHGDRFEDHGIDAAALKEIITFQEIVAETAKILWRKNHPTRERLLKGFDELVKLRLTEIKSGSAAVPLELRVLAEDQKPLWEGPLNEAREAVVKTYETIYAAAFNQPLPVDLPKEILPLYNEFGKSLKPGEAIIVSMMKRGKKRAKFDNAAKKRISRYITPRYEDTTEILGTVLAADVKKGVFVIYPDLYKGFPVNLPAEAEKKVTTALRDHDRVKLNVKGRGVFSAEGNLLKIDEVLEISTLETEKLTYNEKAKPIWEIIEDIVKTIPKEELEKIPKDASSNLDFYLYGVEEE